MQNASVGVRRVLGRLRRSRESRVPAVGKRPSQQIVSRDHLGRRLRTLATASRLAPRHPDQLTERPAGQPHSSWLGRIGHDHVLAVAVAAVLLGASVVSVSAGVSAPSTGNTDGGGIAPRIAIGGDAGGALEGDGGASGSTAGADLTGDVAFGAPDPTGLNDAQFAAIGLGNTAASGADSQSSNVDSLFIDDGTLVKPVAVDTSVPDGSELVQTYKVKSGDTLVGIASKFGVSMMSVWWANDLKNKDDLKIGQVLDIPPVNGLIVTIAATDTLDALAAKYHVNTEDILATNGLDDPNLVVGQVLVIPGARGAPIPTPKPTPKPKTVARSTSHSSSGSSRPPTTYSGGKMLWPVVGGGNYISQYFHTGHYAIDIAATYGSTVRAAASGTVEFAGWKNNGGGYQVWIAHGSGLYTTYNHMSAITVGAGQHVGRGQQVGRIGQTGDATGPHLHFEVWRGPVWNGGVRVNPLLYL